MRGRLGKCDATHYVSRIRLLFGSGFLEKVSQIAVELAFGGGMSAKKYMAITGTSKATATRNMQDLAEKGIFVPTGGWRNTHYQIKL